VRLVEPPGPTGTDAGTLPPPGSTDASVDQAAPSDAGAAGDAPVAIGDAGACAALDASCSFVVSVACGACVASVDYNYPGGGLADQMEFFLNNTGLSTTSHAQFEIVIQDGTPVLDAATYSITQIFSSDGYWANGGPAWFEQSAPALGTQGSLTLVLTSVSQDPAEDSGGSVLATYTVHGTLTEVLPNDQSGQPVEAGAVTFQATF
jgi:hypothetical protein